MKIKDLIGKSFEELEKGRFEFFSNSGHRWSVTDISESTITLYDEMEEIEIPVDEVLEFDILSDSIIEWYN